MDEKPQSSAATVPVQARTSRTILLLLGALLVIGIATGLWFGLGGGDNSPDGMLFVHVWPKDSGDALLVDHPDALPVQSSGSLNLEAQFRQPAFAYLIWIDCQGKLQPLYPWNTSEIEVRDLSQPPPTRRAGKLFSSPLAFGGAWPFGPGSGVETVLLLSRPDAIPENIKLGELFADLPPPVKAGTEKELVIFEIRNHAMEVTTILSRDRGDEAAAKSADEPLKALLLRLSPHFDLVRAVRFAHVEGGSEEAGAKTKAGP